MIFGIGSGLLFFYLPWLKVNSAPGVTYRTVPGAIFSKVARRVGFRIKRQRFSSPARAQQTLDDCLAKGMPVGLQVGVYNLVYLPDEYRFHFNAHNLVVYGKEGNEYLISDPVLSYTTRLTEEELDRVRFAKGVFSPRGHLYYPTDIPKQSIDLRKAIIKGIRQTCNTMLAPFPLVGFRGIEKLSRDIAKWSERYSTKKTNHYLINILRMQEEIGTGGGGFRFVYGAFLQEASAVLGKPELMTLSAEITGIGDAWRDFALEIARLYKQRSSTPDVYKKLSKDLYDIAQREKLFFRKLKAAVEH